MKNTPTPSHVSGRVVDLKLSMRRFITSGPEANVSRILNSIPRSELGIHEPSRSVTPAWPVTAGVVSLMR